MNRKQNLLNLRSVIFVIFGVLQLTPLRLLYHWLLRPGLHRHRRNFAVPTTAKLVRHRLNDSFKVVNLPLLLDIGLLQERQAIREVLEPTLRLLELFGPTVDSDVGFLNIRINPLHNLYDPQNVLHSKGGCVRTLSRMISLNTKV